jgi:hypothetical protein
VVDRVSVIDRTHFVFQHFLNKRTKYLSVDRKITSWIPK